MPCARLSREYINNASRNFFTSDRGSSPLPSGIKPSNGSTSRGVLEIVAEPGRVFFPASWSAARFHGHYLYDQSHRSLSLRARRYAVIVTTLENTAPLNGLFPYFCCCFARNRVPTVIDRARGLILLLLLIRRLVACNQGIANQEEKVSKW